MRITTKKGREFAFKLRAIRNARTGKKKWFVGITTKEYFWLDLNTNLLNTAECFANVLKGRLKTDVYIFETTKSYWLVTKKKLSKEEWDNEYNYWLKFSEEIVCHPFCLCCIRYHKGTLRVSAKKGKRCQLVKVINRLENDGSSVTPRPRNLLAVPRLEALTISSVQRTNINTSVHWLVNTVLNIGVQGIRKALNPYGETESHYILPKMQELKNVYRSVRNLLRRNAEFLGLRSVRGGLSSSFLRLLLQN